MKSESAVASRVRFSIIIATFDRPVELSRCLAAIGALRFPRDQFEVIVVNDGGPPPAPGGLRRLAGDVQLTVVSRTNSGPGAARNAGAEIARGDFLAFMDDDCVPPPDWLVKLSTAVEREPDALIGGHTLNALTNNHCSQASQMLVDYVCSYYNQPGSDRNRFFASNNMAVAADAFHAMGGFDESFRNAEDRELCNRWRAIGGRFHYAPDVIMYHAHQLDLGSLHRQHFGYGRGALPYWQKAAPRGVRGIRVEPLTFYAGMLRFPFRQGTRHPALLSLLILFSQLSNAAGFAFEGLSRAFRRQSAPLLSEETESA